MTAKTWIQKWDEVLSTCGQTNYDLLLNVFDFIESGCYQLQSYKDFLDDKRRSEIEDDIYNDDDPNEE